MGYLGKWKTMTRILLILLFSLGLSRLSTAALVVDEQFTDNERLTQDNVNTPKTSLQWTVGAHRSSNAFGTLNASGGALVLDHTDASSNSSFAGTWAYFTPGGNPISLSAVGDSLSLSFNVSFSGGTFSASGGAFRFGLLNSNNTRVTTDFAGSNETGLSSGTTFSGYRGYEMTAPVNTTANGSSNLEVRERTGTGNGLNTSSNWTSLNSATQEPLFAAGTSYPASLTLTRTAAGIDILGSINGVTTSLISDNTTPVTSFDTISFFTLDSATHNLTLDNIQVDFTPVPEPTTAAGLLLAITAVPLYLRKRKMAKSNQV